MSSAAQLRRRIEDTLSERIPSALSPRARVELERTPCGVAAIDELMQGGLPVGVVSEFVGPESSGRTSMALSFVAATTRSDRVAAWIDVADTFDPESAAANGVDLERLLWVRCGAKQGAASVLEAPAQGLLLPVTEQAQAMPVSGGGSPHPRSEGQGMPQAIQAMLQHGGMYDQQTRREKKSIGTPGAANRPLSSRRSREREEQVSPDRLPSHRAEPRLPEVPRWQVVSGKETNADPFGMTMRDACRRATDSHGQYAALDQALKSADLLLQAGGFTLIVLDLGSVAPERAWRIPLASWFRFRAACERTQVSLLALTQHPCTRSSAELVVRMAAGEMEARSKVMSGVRYRAEIERQRRQGSGNVVPIRKQPQPERGCWSGKAAWVSGL
jgi:recombination protein RecA